MKHWVVQGADWNLGLLEHPKMVFIWVFFYKCNSGMPKPKQIVLHSRDLTSHVLKTWWFSPVNIDWNYIKLSLESLEIINIWIVIKNKICSTVQVFSHSLFLSIWPSWYQTVPFLNGIFSPVLVPDHFQMIFFFCCFSVKPFNTDQWIQAQKGT